MMFERLVRVWRWLVGRWRRERAFWTEPVPRGPFRGWDPEESAWWV